MASNYKEGRRCSCIISTDYLLSSKLILICYVGVIIEMDIDMDWMCNDLNLLDNSLVETKEWKRMKRAIMAGWG